MKNTLLFICVAAVSWLLTSCTEEPDGLQIHNYLIFGTFQEGCQSNCTEIYYLNLDDQMLMIAENPTYPVYEADSFPYGGNFISVPQQQYELVKDLKNMIPQNLYGEINLVVGDTVTAGGKGIYVEGNYQRTGFKHYINADKNLTPAYLHDFVDEVLDRIEKLHAAEQSGQ
jgi:hypothetical protein